MKTQHFPHVSKKIKAPLSLWMGVSIFGLWSPYFFFFFFLYRNTAVLIQNVRFVFTSDNLRYLIYMWKPARAYFRDSSVSHDVTAQPQSCSTDSCWAGAKTAEKRRRRRSRRRVVCGALFSPTSKANAMYSVCNKVMAHRNTSNLFSILKTKHLDIFF